MLDRHHQAVAIGQDPTCLPCDIELPESWRGFFQETGVTTARLEERRQYPRFRLRGPAAMRIVTSLPRLDRASHWYKIFTKDVSRTGLSFLHSEQLFPGEEVEVLVPGGRQYHVQVRRSRRVAGRCYVIGARFLI